MIRPRHFPAGVSRWALLGALAFIAGALLLAACGESENGGNEEDTLAVHVGLIQSLSGSGGSYGTTSHRGITLALEEIAHSEDWDLTITTALLDDTSLPDIATEAMQDLVAEGVDAIIGPTLSGIAFEIHPLAQEAGIVVLSPTTTAAGIPDTGDHIFSVALTEARVVPEVVSYVTAEHGVNRAVLFWDSEESFSPFSAAAMRDGLEQAGGTMVAEIDLSQQELEGGIASLAGLDFDLVFVSPLLDVSVEVMEALREAGYQQVVIGGNSFNTLQISERAGEAVEGVYVGAAWNPAVDIEASERFIRAYEAEYEEAPEQFAAQGYSSVYILADAVQRAGSSDPEAIRAALLETSDVETPLGLISFDAQRYAVHEPVIQRYEGGALTVVAP